MNDTLKAAGRIGAELGAAKAENEKLREVLRCIADLPMDRCSTENDYRLSAAKAIALGALSQQAEPDDDVPDFVPGSGNKARRRMAAIALAAENQRVTPVEPPLAPPHPLAQQAEPVRCPGTEDTASMDSYSAQEQFTAVDMATAAAQGFRDGQAAVEQAAAQDARKTFEVEIPDISAIYDGRSFIPYRSLEAGERLMTVAQHLRIEKQLRAALTRPAQTEQQPILAVKVEADCVEHVNPEYGGGYFFTEDAIVEMYAAPIAQTAPQGKFRMGDLVKKTSGSEWEGHVCGWYSTNQTPEGYAVESEAHAGSVQIYPAKALELVPMAAKEA